MNEITLNEAGGTIFDNEVKNKSMRLEAKAIGLIFLGFVMQAISMIVIWLCNSEFREFSDMLWGSMKNDVTEVIGTGAWAVMLFVYAASFLVCHIASLIMLRKNRLLMFFPIQFALTIFMFLFRSGGPEEIYGHVIMALVLVFMVFSIITAIWWYAKGRKKYGVEVSKAEQVMMVYIAFVTVMLVLFPAYNFELGL